MRGVRGERGERGEGEGRERGAGIIRKWSQGIIILLTCK